MGFTKLLSLVWATLCLSLLPQGLCTGFSQPSLSTKLLIPDQPPQLWGSLLGLVQVTKSCPSDAALPFVAASVIMCLR